MNKVFRPRPRILDMRHYRQLDLWAKYADDTDVPSTIGGESKFTDLEDEMVIWCEKNCIGEILYYEDMSFYFEHDDDRLAFKLAWG